jgi:hypothetical protein
MQRRGRRRGVELPQGQRILDDFVRPIPPLQLPSVLPTPQLPIPARVGQQRLDRYFSSSPVPSETSNLGIILLDDIIVLKNVLTYNIYEKNLAQAQPRRMS